MEGVVFAAKRPLAVYIRQSLPRSEDNRCCTAIEPIRGGLPARMSSGAKFDLQRVARKRSVHVLCRKGQTMDGGRCLIYYLRSGVCTLPMCQWRTDLAILLKERQSERKDGKWCCLSADRDNVPIDLHAPPRWNAELSKRELWPCT